MNKFVIIISVISIVDVTPKSLNETTQEAKDNDLYSIIENNLFYTINNELQKTINKLFLSLKLNRTFSTQHDTRLLLSMFATLKEVSEKLYKNYKNVTKASRLDIKFHKFQNNSLFKLDIPIEEIINEDFQTNFENNRKTNGIELSENSIEIPDDSKGAVIVLREHLTNEQNIELADIEKPSQKIRQIYEKHRQFRQASNRNFKIWEPTNSSDFDFDTRRVFNGRQVKTKQYPFVASIHVRNEFVCTGAIISRDFIITAASCLNSIQYNPKYLQEYPPILLVRVGSDYPDRYGDVIEASNFYVYPKYNKKYLRNNIAMIKIKKHLHLRNKNKKIRRIGIQRKDVLRDVYKVSLLGWGDEDEPSSIKKTNDSLSISNLKVVRNMKDCINIYTKKYIAETNFCAGVSKNGTGACQHDIGGPAIVQNLLVGVVSFGPHVCGVPNAPTVFTNVGFYSDWIDSVVKLKSKEMVVAPGILSMPGALRVPDVTVTPKNGLYSTAGYTVENPPSSSRSSSQSEESLTTKPPEGKYSSKESSESVSTAIISSQSEESIAKNSHSTKESSELESEEAVSTTPNPSSNTITEKVMATRLMEMLRSSRAQVNQNPSSIRNATVVIPIGNLSIAMQIISNALKQFMANKNIIAIPTTAIPVDISIATNENELTDKDLLRDAKNLKDNVEIADDFSATSDSENDSDNYENYGISIEMPDKPLSTVILQAFVPPTSTNSPKLKKLENIFAGSKEAAALTDETDLNNKLMIKNFVKNKLVPINSELGSSIKKKEFEKSAEEFLLKNFMKGHLLSMNGYYNSPDASKLRERHTSNRINQIDHHQTTVKEKKFEKERVYSSKLSKLRYLKTPPQIHTGLYSREVTKPGYNSLHKRSKLIKEGVYLNFNDDTPFADMMNLEKEIVRRLKTERIPLVDVLRWQTELMKTTLTANIDRSDEERGTTLATSLNEYTLTSGTNTATQKRFKKLREKEHYLKRLQHNLKRGIKNVEEKLKKTHELQRQRYSKGTTSEYFAKNPKPTKNAQRLFPYRYNSDLKRIAASFEMTELGSFSHENVEALYDQFHNITFILNETSLEKLFRSDTMAETEPKGDLDYYYYLPELEEENVTNVEDDFFDIIKVVENQENVNYR